MPRADPWPELERELDCWAADGRTARLWLRDDDATEATPALDRLLATTSRHAVPLLLAVIPFFAQPSLARQLAGAAWVSPCQHGCAHHNHAPAGEKKQELGDHRPAAAVLAELAKARDHLADLLGDRVRPVLVPPWNRIAPAVEAGLPSLGFEALSTFGPAPAAAPLPRMNCDIDIIDWKGGRRGHEPAVLVSGLAEALAAARRGGHRPVGILAHHLVHDTVAWSFLDELLARTTAHPAARWVPFGALVC